MVDTNRFFVSYYENERYAVSKIPSPEARLSDIYHSRLTGKYRQRIPNVHNRCILSPNHDAKGLPLDPKPSSSIQHQHTHCISKDNTKMPTSKPMSQMPRSSRCLPSTKGISLHTTAHPRLPAKPVSVVVMLNHRR